MNRRLLPVLAFAGALTLGAARAQSPATIEVTFEHPERFTDVRTDRMTTDRERGALLDELRAWIEREAPRRLPPGTRLSVTITDVDMAGEFEPWLGTSASHVRIVRDVYPARMSLSFRLSDASGKLLKEGARKLSTAFFVDRARAGRPLGHEKALFEDWLAREFA
jgi:hypothetical protein